MAQDKQPRGVLSGVYEEMGGRPSSGKEYTFVKRSPQQQSGFNWHAQKPGSLNRDTMKDAVVIINSMSDIGNEGPATSAERKRQLHKKMNTDQLLRYSIEPGQQPLGRILPPDVARQQRQASMFKTADYLGSQGSAQMHHTIQLFDLKNSSESGRRTGISNVFTQPGTLSGNPDTETQSRNI